MTLKNNKQTYFPKPIFLTDSKLETLKIRKNNNVKKIYFLKTNIFNNRCNLFYKYIYKFQKFVINGFYPEAVSYTHLRAHETEADLVCRLLLEKKK